MCADVGAMCRVTDPALIPTQRQRPPSAGNGEKAGSKDKPAAKQESTLSLTAEEMKVLRRIQEEDERRGGFIRIFPTAETWELYGEYLESKTSMNYTVANRLFHGRNVNGNVQLQVESIHDCHVLRYERKLLTLETHKRRRCHLANRSAAGKRKSGKESKTSLTLSSSQEAEECAQEEREEAKEALAPPPPPPLSNRALEAELRKQMAASLERRHAEALSSSQAAGHKVSLLNVLQQGWDLSKVQARKAFSSYLQRVQQRLLAESRTDTVPARPDKHNDHMDLVIRFLKRASSNLQQDLQVAFPSRQLPLQDRRRILSHQLGEFIRCYDEETEKMVKQQVSDGGHCVNAGVFQEYVSAASESELEEVLTFYTQKNKSSTIFLGSQGRSVKEELCEGNGESSKNVPAADKYPGYAEQTFATTKLCRFSDAEAAARRPPVQQEAAVTTQPEIQAPQRCSSFPAAGDSANPQQQQRRLPGSATLPLYCPPPPLPPPPPQLPSYAQSLAKSHFRYAECPPDPPAYASSSAVVSSQPLRGAWTPVSPGNSHPNQVLRRIQSFTASVSCGGASSIPGTVQLYSQKLSRPSSTIHVTKRSDSTKLKSNSVGTFRELHARPEQAQSNQQAFISALQKLADKQAARRYASSSHINLLTHHLTQMNLANRMLSRDAFALNPQVQHAAAPAARRPAEGVRPGTQLCSSAGPQKDGDDAFKSQTQSPYSLLAATTPQQVNPPAPGSNQLQSAIKKMQQQRLRSRPFLDQSHRGQQAHFPDQTTPQVSTISSVCPSTSFHVHLVPGQVPGPGVVPKPPSSARDGQTKKTAAKRLVKQTSSEWPAGGGVSSSQRTVYEAICGKTGLSLYHKLFQGQVQVQGRVQDQDQVQVQGPEEPVHR